MKPIKIDFESVSKEEKKIGEASKNCTVLKMGVELYKVNDKYQVTCVTDGIYICECMYFKFKKKDCKHIIACIAYKNRNKNG